MKRLRYCFTTTQRVELWSVLVSVIDSYICKSVLFNCVDTEIDAHLRALIKGYLIDEEAQSMVP